MKKYLNTISQGLQKVGPAIMPVIAVLPIAGFLLGIGSAIQQDAMIELIPALGASGVQMFAGIINSVGNLIIGNLGLFFAVGIAMNLAGKKSMAAFSALLAFLVMNKTIEVFLSLDAEKVANSGNRYATVLGINTLQTGVFGGLVIGIMVYLLYKKFSEVEFPMALSFFQGERFVPIISTLGGIIMGFVMILIWPPVQGVFDAFTNWLIDTPYRFLAVFLYGFFMRLVQAFGLQHLIYPFFYFQMGEYVNKAGEVIKGDSPIFFAQMADGVPITAGGFMTGSYINSIMCVAVAMAIVHTAKKSKKAATKGVMTSGAITAAFTGVSEPIEFSYLLISPFLWVVNSIMVGLGYAVTDALQIRLGTGLAGNIIDYILYGIIPKSTNYLLLIPVGAVFFVVQYCLFRFFITKFDIKTPGREDDDDLENDSAVAADETGVVLAAKMIEYLGGKDNIKTLTNCFTRVRTTVKDKSAVQKDKFKTLGAKGVTEPSEDGLQVIFGPQSEKIVNNMKRVMNRIVTVPKEAVLIVNDTLTDTADICGKEDFVSPATGKLIPLSQVKDPVFAEKTLGDGFAVEPIDSRIVSPVNGTIAMVFPTKHAVAITSDLGKEMLIHMGIDTVELNGKGFEILVKEGDTVETGTPIAKMDLSLLRKEGKDTVIPVIMTNSGEKTVRVSPYGEVKEGQVIDFDVQ